MRSFIRDCVRIPSPMGWWVIGCLAFWFFVLGSVHAILDIHS